MRSIVCRYETADALGEALASADRELELQSGATGSDPPPSGRRRGPAGADGEWVLVIVEVGTHATASAARVVRHEEQLALAFEPRDWQKLQHWVGEGPPSTVRVHEDPPVRRSGHPIVAHSRKSIPADSSHLLLVDDDFEVSEVLQTMLEAVGLSVTAVRTGEEGLQRLAAKNARFDLAVVDWTLPKMSGLDLCRAARERGITVPILFLTANAAASDVVAAFASGADDYVVKPFRAPELGARIFGLLRRARTVKEGR